MLSKSDRSLIRQCRLFEGVGMDSIEALLDQCPVMELRADETLLSPQQENDCLHLVLEGRLSVHAADDEAAGSVELGPAECVGELSQVAGRHASAHVTAVTDCRVLVVPPDALWLLIDRSHGVARNLLRILAGRMRDGERGIIIPIAGHPQFGHAVERDALTGLRNRHGLELAFDRCVRRCARSGEALSLILANVDRFRHYNDFHGQETGDRALRALSRELEEHLRPTDLIARSGRAEFAILLPGASLAQAVLVAERLRASAAGAECGTQGGRVLPPVTLSAGVAELQIGDTSGSLMARAEAALFRAKLNGRNRVEIAMERVAA